MRHAPKVALCALLWAGACSFDRGGFDARRCHESSDCSPGQSCAQGVCDAMVCTVASDCGTTHAFVCTRGLCVAKSCSGDSICSLGFGCVDGFCRAGCFDRDQDGTTYGPTCVGAVDCNDGDADETPGAAEGPPDSATCRDGKDNDCNGATDRDDLTCQECEGFEDCDNSLFCDGEELCVDHVCVPGTAVDCSSLDDVAACLVGSCDEQQDQCIAEAQMPGAACDDGDGCTMDDTCEAAGCTPGPVRDSDGDSYGDALCGGRDCDDTRTAVHPGATEGPLDDPTCLDGLDNDCDSLLDDADTACRMCESEAECDDLNSCTDDTCTEARTCLNLPNDANPATDDGASCTVDSCQGGMPVHMPVDERCADSDVCTDETCAPGFLAADPLTGCRVTFSTAPCDDGDSCTTDDVCAGGLCAGAAVSCTDGRSCTTDVCNGDGTCSHALLSGRCLIGGTCYVSGAVNPINPCEECVPDVAPMAWTPDDENLCGDGVCEACVDSACVPTSAGVLGPGCTQDTNPCNDDYCNGSGSCVHPNDDSNTCGDGTCEACVAGACVPTPSGALGQGCAADANPCTDDHCDGSGACIHPNDDTNTCGDGVCDECTAGTCDPTPASTPGPGCAADSNPCTDDYCDGSGSCIHPNDDSNTCDDGICETCAAGTCAPTSLGTLGAGCAADTNPCTDDYCDGAGSCIHPADDSNACSDGICEACVAGVCAPTTSGTIGPGCAADSNPCTDDHCDGSGNCVHPNDDSNSCTDGIPCTEDTCAAGICGATLNDATCGSGQVCRPTCFSDPTGCGALPTLAVACDSPVVLGAGGSTCTINLGALTDQLSCLSCSAQPGMVLLDQTSFDGCDLGSWTTVSGTFQCASSLVPLPYGLGDGMALEAQNGSFTIQTTVDTTGLDQVRFCFDYAAKDPDPGERVEVEMDVPGPAFTTYFADTHGPTGEKDANYVPTCLDLDDLAAGAARNPALGIRMTVTATSANDRVIIDNLVIHGWRDADVSFSSAWQSGFGTATCDLNPWTVTGGPICPLDSSAGSLAGQIALEAKGPSGAASDFTIATEINAAGFCEDVRVAFRHGTTGSVNEGERMTLEFDSGSGWTTAFASEGSVDAAGSFFDFGSCASGGAQVGCSASLSDRAQDAAWNPALGLRFRLQADDGGRLVFLDDVNVTGAVCAQSAVYLALGPITETGGGIYQVTVESSEQAAVHLTCTWGGPVPAATSRQRIVFVP